MPKNNQKQPCSGEREAKRYFLKILKIIFYIFITLLNQKQTKSIIIKLSKMKNIKKLQNQIKILNTKIQLGKVKNAYAVMGKVKKLKEQLQVEIDLFNWENYLSQ